MDTALRSVRLHTGHTLTVWDAHTRAHYGQHQLRYTFLSPVDKRPCVECDNPAGVPCHHRSQVQDVLFCGADYGVAPSHAIDSDAALLELLGFLSLQPGDTDSDYFAEYTPEQMEWAESSACESLSCDVSIAEEAGGCCCAMVWENADDWDSYGGCEDRPAVLTYRVIDHGEDGEQYFPGCGTAHTEYTHVATGIGDTASEALDDALEMMATDGHTVSKLQESMMRQDLGTDSRNAHDSTVVQAECHCEDDSEGHDCPAAEHDCEAGLCNPEWHHYVSIRYTIRGED